MKSEMSFWKSSFFFIKYPTHVIRNIQSFDCHVFWKHKLTQCRIKMAFSMVLCINLNPWYCVYHLMVYDEVSFAWISKKKKTPKSTLRLYQERLFLFLALILSACIITHSLIHEVTTLIEKLLKFRECHLSVQIICSIKKGF